MVFIASLYENQSFECPCRCVNDTKHKIHAFEL